MSLEYVINGSSLIISGIPDEDALNIEDALESLVCNSELQWVNPADTGDLTDAPTLGILGEEFLYSGEGELPYPCVFVGSSEKGKYFCRITHRWAYMDYQIKSPLEDLRENHEIIFTGGEL